MLYYLFQYLDKLDVPGAGAFKYISTRSGLAIALSLFISMVIGRTIIDYLRKMQIGETIRDLGLEGQMGKKGTPTMGGIIIIISIIIPCLLLGRMDNVYMILMIVTTLWMGAIGFIDDYIKVIKKDKEGLRGCFKIAGQVILGLFVGLILYFSPQVVIRENNEVVRNGTVEHVIYKTENVKSTDTTVPFFKNNNFNYHSIVSFMDDHTEAAGWIIFAIMAILVVTAVSNGANLTDGLDGLTAGTSSIIGATLLILAYLGSHLNFASYLNIMYIPHSEELVVFMSAFVGATFGFLWYNSYPAQVFMGDTGSLTIGGIIGVFAIAIHKELLIPVLCGVFFVESLSVIIQRTYFKFTKKRTGVGRRVFKMSPLHHHFQKAGGTIEAIIQKPFNPVPESKIVTRFWLISFLLAVLTLVTLKLR